MHEKLITSMAANNLSYLALLITSLLIFNSHMQVFNKYRAYGYAFTVFIPLAYVVLLAFNVDSLGVVTQIDTTKLGIGNYMMMLIIVVGCAGIYFFVLNIIETIKGETINVKSKSRS